MIFFYKYKINWIFKSYKIRNLKKVIGVLGLNSITELNLLDYELKKIDFISLYNKDYKTFYKELNNIIKNNKSIEYIEIRR